MNPVSEEAIRAEAERLAAEVRRRRTVSNRAVATVIVLWSALWAGIGASAATWWGWWS